VSGRNLGRSTTASTVQTTFRELIRAATIIQRKGLTGLEQEVMEWYRPFDEEQIATRSSYLLEISLMLFKDPYGISIGVSQEQLSEAEAAMSSFVLRLLVNLERDMVGADSIRLVKPPEHKGALCRFLIGITASEAMTGAMSAFIKHGQESLDEHLRQSLTWRPGGNCPVVTGRVALIAENERP